jgi:DNA transformation protein
MVKLTELPNIGRTVAARLAEVGIADGETLRRLGSRAAFLKLQAVDEGACLSMLCGLEGAIRGVRWHELDAATKRELREFHAAVRQRRP